MIKLDSYFFNYSSYRPNPKQEGRTRRSPFTGTIHTDYTTKYYEFNLTLEDIDDIQYGHLLFLLNKSIEGGTIQFTDDVGEDYKVIIPVNGMQPRREQGEGEYYRVDLELWEVKGDVKSNTTEIEGG